MYGTDEALLVYGQEGAYGGGVKLRATVSKNFCERFFRRHGCPVHPVRRHSVERVRDHEDARAQRNLLTGQPLAVAAAIETLVVGENDVAHGYEEIDGAEDFRAGPV